MKKYLNEKIQIIETALEKYLPVHANLQSAIYNAMRYSMFAGGKRLRPVLAVSVCEMCGETLDKVIPFACALEMIHTYSLIHDDLPAMDNDTLRRGKPTCHIQFDEATAILAGDALLTRAFEIATDMNELSVSPQTALHAAKILSSCAGTEGMIGGQVIDIQSNGKTLSPNELIYMHRLKTGALITAAVLIGGVAAGVSEQSQLRDFADYLGLAFQIQDDILDVVGSQQQLGKPIGSDKKNKKNTYITLYGLDKACRMAAEYSYKAETILSSFGNKAEFLIWLTRTLTKRVS